MTRAQRKQAERFVATENAMWPRQLAPVPRENWPEPRLGAPAPVAVLRSSTFLMQVFEEPSGHRLSINRTVIVGWNGDWPNYMEGISWEDMQRLKAEAGFADRWAVEVFPPDSEIVNAANMRHLWLLAEPPSFGWRRAPKGASA